MVSITIHDEKTGEMVKLNFTPTGQKTEAGNDVCAIETEFVTDLDAIKESASPMFKSALQVLMVGFGVAYTKQDGQDEQTNG